MISKGDERGDVRIGRGSAVSTSNIKGDLPGSYTRGV